MVVWIGNPWNREFVSLELPEETDQHPPAFSLRSKTLIVPKACSWASASTVIAPAGPAPITATDLVGIIFEGIQEFRIAMNCNSWNTAKMERDAQPALS